MLFKSCYTVSLTLCKIFFFCKLHKQTIVVLPRIVGWGPDGLTRGLFFRYKFFLFKTLSLAGVILSPHNMCFFSHIAGQQQRGAAKQILVFRWFFLPLSLFSFIFLRERVHFILTVCGSIFIANFSS